MKHGRPDYQRIQDPAADIVLVEAFKAAQRALQAGVTSSAVNDLARTTEALHSLVIALSPTLGPVVEKMPRNPIEVQEPVFLLRARDLIAPDIVREYARRYRQTANAGGDGQIWAVHEQITDVAKAMEDWQNRFGHKLPDAPIGGGR